MELIKTINSSKTANQKSFRLISNVDGISKRYEKCGFKNFITKDENKKALQECRSIQPGESITLTGLPGTGKTHLAIATLRNFPMIPDNNQTEVINKEGYLKNLLNNGSVEEKHRAKELLESETYKWRKAHCKFLPAPELFLQLSESFSSDKSKSEMLNALLRCDCICIDDLGAEKLSDTNRQNLYLVIDRCYREMKSLIITSNLAIEELNEYEPRIASRLAEMGKIFFINGNDYRLI